MLIGFQAVDQQLATDVNLCINVDNINISDANTGRVSAAAIGFSLLETVFQLMPTLIRTCSIIV